MDNVSNGGRAGQVPAGGSHRKKKKKKFPISYINCYLCGSKNLK